MLNGLLISRIEFFSEFASLAWIPAILSLLRMNVLSLLLLSSVLLAVLLFLKVKKIRSESGY